MRFVVFGAGAIGGVVGGRLAEHGCPVVLIARGAHYEAIAERGLRIESPAGTAHVAAAAADHPARVDWAPDDVVLLAVKSHDTAAAVRDLAAAAPPDVPILCLQNGVENEPIAAAAFPNVYGVCVMCPTSYLTPGVVQAWSTPTTGILDLGRYPGGTDAMVEAVAAAFAASTFVSTPRADIMRWKYGKLLMNLGNVIEAICNPPPGAKKVSRLGALPARGGPFRQELAAATLRALVRREGEACMAAAGIAYVGEEEDTARRGDILRIGAIAGLRRGGGSTWQSLARHAGELETDFLNGEIVRLGSKHGVPTPVNAALQDLARRLAREGAAPGTMTHADLLAHVWPGRGSE